MEHQVAQSGAYPMTHVVNGVIWKSRIERLWALLLLEYTESRIRWADLLEKR